MTRMSKAAAKRILERHDDWELGRQIERKDAEIAKLRAAIEWALGSGPAPDGSHFGDKKPEATGDRPYWWRAELRDMADI